MSIDSVTLLRVGSPGDTDRASAWRSTTTRWEAEHRTVQVGDRSEDTLLVIPENTNPGWAARLDGRAARRRSPSTAGSRATSSRAGAAGTVELDFAPGPYYRAALAVGAGAVLLLLVVARAPGAAAARARAPARQPPGHGVVRRVPCWPRVRRRRPVLFGTALVGGLVGLAALAGSGCCGSVTGRGRAGAPRRSRRSRRSLAAGGCCSPTPRAPAPSARRLAVVALAAVVAGVLPVLPVPRALHPSRDARHPGAGGA